MKLPLLHTRLADLESNESLPSYLFFPSLLLSCAFHFPRLSSLYLSSISPLFRFKMLFVLFAKSWENKKKEIDEKYRKNEQICQTRRGNSSELRLNMTILGRSNINILYLLCDLYALQLVFTCKFHQYAYLSGVDVDVSVEMREGREEIREEPTTVVDRAERNHSAQSLKWDSQMGGEPKKWLQTWDIQLYSIQIDC